MSKKISEYIRTTSIPGVLIIEKPIYRDFRGFFHEVFRVNELEKASGVKFDPVQWSHSMSLPGVIRAIHTENWNKLIYPVAGKLFAPIVDVRPESPTFGKVETFVIDNTKEDSTHMAIFLPKGIGNSICAVGSEPLHYLYLVDEYWDDKKARGIAWDDPDLAIKWPVKNPSISERDKGNPRLRDLYPDKFKSK